MVIKIIKNLENLNFRGVEIPKHEKKMGRVGTPKSLTIFGWVEFPPKSKSTFLIASVKLFPAEKRIPVEVEKT